MPLTAFQERILARLAERGDPGRYLAGGAALHHARSSPRFSDDLDFFHDSEVQVAAAFAADRAQLEADGLRVTVQFSQPGFIRAIVSSNGAATRVDWAHDSAWRFFPLVHESWGGWVLHPIDLAINKLLAVVGRNEPRDVIDLLWCDAEIVPAGVLVWAAPGKDPGLSPLLALDLLRRRGLVRSEELARLAVREPLDARAVRAQWRAMLGRAESFVRERPPEEVGVLYLDSSGGVIAPRADRPLADQGLVAHRGAPGGVIPVLPDVGLR